MEGSAIAGIIISDALTPGQYYDGIRADDGRARPIKRLMLAVLEDAMRCYQTYANSRSRTQRRLFVEAEMWLMDRRADGAFAFETVCETLGIDPSCLREGLRRWRMQELDGMHPRRLARRSPVTRLGQISAPLRRRRRKRTLVPGGYADGVAVAANGKGAAHHHHAAARDGLGYVRCGEIEGGNRSAETAGAAASAPSRVAIEEVVSALM
ncbi:MAG TPA: hypothetical protein VNE82_00145 [Candidatus Binataceae bacterium]|nr:hypothetical protein [Candidatus Binataceae bacterium]